MEVSRRGFDGGKGKGRGSWGTIDTDRGWKHWLRILAEGVLMSVVQCIACWLQMLFENWLLRCQLHASRVHSRMVVLVGHTKELVTDGFHFSERGAE